MNLCPNPKLKAMGEMMYCGIAFILFLSGVNIRFFLIFA